MEKTRRNDEERKRKKHMKDHDAKREERVVFGVKKRIHGMLKEWRKRNEKMR